MTDKITTYQTFSLKFCLVVKMQCLALNNDKMTYINN